MDGIFIAPIKGGWAADGVSKRGDGSVSLFLGPSLN